MPFKSTFTEVITSSSPSSSNRLPADSRQETGEQSRKRMRTMEKSDSSNGTPRIRIMFNTERDDLKKTVQNLEKQVVGLTVKLDLITKENFEMKTHLEEKNQKIQSLQLELENSRRLQSDLKYQTAEFAVLRNESASRISNLQQDLNYSHLKLQNLYEEQNSKIETIKNSEESEPTTTSPYPKQMENLEKLRDSMIQEIQRVTGALTLKNEELKGIEQSHNSETQQMKLQIEQIKSSMAQQAKIYEAKDEELRNVKEEIVDCRQIYIAEVERLENQLKLKNQEIAKLQESRSKEFTELNREIVSKNKELETFECQISKLQKENQDLKEPLELKNNESLKIKKSHKEYQEEMDSQIKKLRETISDLKTDILNLKNSKYLEMENLKNIKNMEFDEIRKANVSKMEHLEKSKNSTIDFLETQRQELKKIHVNKVAEIEKLKKDLESKNHELKDLRSSTNSEIHVLKSRITDLDKGFADMKTIMKRF